MTDEDWIEDAEQLLDAMTLGEDIAPLLARLPLERRGEVEAFLNDRNAVLEPPAFREQNALPIGGKIGRYELRGLLGSGGQGQVFDGYDPDLGRPVALKILNGGAHLDSASVARFRREALAASRIEDPGICGVYDVGEVDGVAFLAMPRIDGVDLSRALLTGTSMTLFEKLSFVEAVARSIHVAHERGVVHRDLKPSNIMVRPSGRPVILDFGLAALEEGHDTVTRVGATIGTPAYMAPEQIDRALGVPDRRADVWSLGAITYELLTSERPFEASTRQALFREILEATPPPLPRAIPRDVQRVLAVALAKDRDERYSSARAFADDLRAVRSGEPVSVRPLGALRATLKRVRRRPGLALAAFLIVSLMGSALVFSWKHLAEARHAISVSKEAQLRLEQQIQRQEAARLLAEARNALEREPAVALALTARSAAIAPGPLVRATRWLALDRAREVNARALLARPVTACVASDRILVQLATGELLRIGPSPDQEVRLLSVREPLVAMAALPDRLLLASSLGELLTLEGETLIERVPIAAAVGRVVSLHGTEEGHGLVVGRTGFAIHQGNPWASRALVSRHPERFRCVTSALLARGRLVLLGEDGRALLVSLANPQTVLELPLSSGPDAVLAGGGDVLWVGKSDGGVDEWDVDPPELRRRRKGGGAGVTSLFCHPNKGLVAGARDGVLRVWSGEQGDAPIRLLGPRGNVMAAAFSAQDTVLTLGSDGVVRLFQRGPTKRMATREFGSALLISVVLFRAGIGVLTPLGSLASLDLETLADQEEPSPPTQSLIMIGSGGARRFGTTRDGEVLVADARSGWRSIGVKSPLPFVVDSRGERILVANSNARELVSVSVPVEVRARFEGSGCAAFSKSGAQIAAWIPGSGVLDVRDATTGAALREIQTGAAVTVVAFVSETGLVFGDVEGGVHHVDLSRRDGIPLRLAGHGDSVTHLAVSKGAVLSGSRDGTVRRHDLSERPRSTSLPEHASAVSVLAFSERGSYILSAAADGVVRLLATSDDSVHLEIQAHETSVAGAFFADQDRLIVSWASDGQVRVWPVEPLDLDPFPTRRLLPLERRAHGVDP